MTAHNASRIPNFSVYFKGMEHILRFLKPCYHMLSEPSGRFYLYQLGCGLSNVLTFLLYPSSFLLALGYSHNQVSSHVFKEFPAIWQHCELTYQHTSTKV